MKSKVDEYKKYLENKSGKLTDSEQTYLWAHDFFGGLLGIDCGNGEYFYIDDDLYGEESVLLCVNINTNDIRRGYRLRAYGNYNSEGLRLYFSHKFNINSLSLDFRDYTWDKDIILSMYKSNIRNKLIKEIINDQ